MAAQSEAELSQILHHLPLGVLTFTADGTLIHRNVLATQLLTPLLGESALDNVFYALRHIFPELAAAVAGYRQPTGTIVDQRRIDGHIGPRRLLLSLTISRVAQSQYMAVIRDITRLTDMATFAFANADLLVDAAADGTIGWASGAFGPLLNRNPSQVIGTRLTELIAPRDREDFAKMLATGGSGRLPPTTLRLDNPAQTRCTVAGLTIAGENRHFFLTIGQCPETPEALVLAPKDFGIEAANWVRGGQPAVLGLLDVSDWRQTTAGMNDTKRDTMMREIGRLTNSDSSMVVGEVGDGRFGVLGPVGTDLARLGDALTDLVASFSPSGTAQVTGSHVDLDTSGLSVTESVQALRIVLSRFAAGGTDAEGLTGGLSGIIEQATHNKRALAAIIEGGRFTLLYQPLVGLTDRVIHHHEALLRPMPGPDNPAANPQEFVTMVEAVGLSVALDRAVLQRALTAIAESDMSVAVNVSGLSIADTAFVNELVTAAGNVVPGRLLVELTETAEIDDLAAAAARIARLRSVGAKVCLDDFGAGSASFRYLRDLRVDMVKIDGAYVQAAGRSAKGRAFVHSMRELATSSGAETIAEMVETEAEAALMRELGVHYGQGWLFGRPAAMVAAAPRRWKY
jgi:EAL domain-containing protein (putative c-di-GMP-specific phosphodiesterase class I)/PAS domain-containing protein